MLCLTKNHYSVVRKLFSAIRSADNENSANAFPEISTIFCSIRPKVLPSVSVKAVEMKCAAAITQRLSQEATTDVSATEAKIQCILTSEYPIIDMSTSEVWSLFKENCVEGKFCRNITAKKFCMVPLHLFSSTQDQSEVKFPISPFQATNFP